MKSLLSIASASGGYQVNECHSLTEALAAVPRDGTLALIDRFVFESYAEEIRAGAPHLIWLPLVATEGQKSFEQLSPVFVWLLENGLKRDGRLLVVGGGVLQDIGCFVASVLFRGVAWDFIPTTLLAQCDSCIGSKSSINIQSYKNQIGTFYAPQQIYVVPPVLGTLPWDEVRSGLGEVIKLHLLAGKAPFQDLLQKLPQVENDRTVLADCVRSSLFIKKPYIETDEHDKGIRNLLNYGHTFGHAYESASHYEIPHGIAVTLGMLTASFISMRLNMIAEADFHTLKTSLMPWYQPYERLLISVPLEFVLSAIKLDKKNTKQGQHFILTHGPGRMEKVRLGNDLDLGQLIGDAIRAIQTS